MELAKAGDKDAMLRVIKHQFVVENKSYLSGNNKLILGYLQTLADDGNGYAMRHLGNLYYYGSGVAKDMAKAIEWYEKAAEQGDAYAICDLGYCYFYGNGVDKNLEKSFLYFSQATLLENVNATYRLGDMYYYGNHVKEDKTAAFHWYKQAWRVAEYAGHSYEVASVKYRLGKCYLHGHGVKKDIQKAFRNLISAEENLLEQIENGDVYAVAGKILPKVKKELDDALIELCRARGIVTK
jgi:TPR repeat protein